jgi:hypothetical protein
LHILIKPSLQFLVLRSFFGYPLVFPPPVIFNLLLQLHPVLLLHPLLALLFLRVNSVQSTLVIPREGYVLDGIYLLHLHLPTLHIALTFIGRRNAFYVTTVIVRRYKPRLWRRRIGIVRGRICIGIILDATTNHRGRIRLHQQ